MTTISPKIIQNFAEDQKREGRKCSVQVWEIFIPGRIRKGRPSIWKGHGEEQAE
jgi:hypothetical protein